MHLANSDGLGMMFPNKGDIYGRKFNALGEMVDAIKLLGRGRPIVLHFRQATHGGKTIDYAQPFPFPIKDPVELYLPKWVAPVGVAHNGILSGFGDSMYSNSCTSTMLKDGVTHYWDYEKRKWVPESEYKKKEEKHRLSDTQEFLCFLSDDRNLVRAFMNWDKACLKLMQKLLSSKWAFMGKNGKVKLIGDWSMQKGIWYSNFYWKNRVITKVPSSSTTYIHQGWHRYENDNHWAPGRRWDATIGKWVEEKTKDNKLTMSATEVQQDFAFGFGGMYD